MHDKDAREARIFAEVGGEVQLGRTAWLRSAGEYPALLPFASAGAAAVAAQRATPLPAARGAPKPRPLEGYLLADQP